MAGFSVSEFSANIKTDYSRANLFEVIVDDMDLKFECKATNIPSSTIGKIEVPYKNKKVPIAGDRVFEDWTITVMNSQEFDIRQKFERWSADAAGHETGEGGIPIDYRKSGQVKKINRDGSDGALYKFKNIWIRHFNWWKLLD